MSNNEKLTASVEVYASKEKVWQMWATPQHIMQWNNISDEWHTPYVENNLEPQGRFLFRMGLKHGSVGFDYKGRYDEVTPYEKISILLDDGRTSTITFSGSNPVLITERFDPDGNEPVDMQRDFCQAILNSFKKYTENAPA
jgi:uncharacterized protein YndB with AHSA1/START domain